MEISKFTNAIRKVLPLRPCGAVIVAAGTASRMGGIDKVMAPLGGEPMIVRTVRTFQDCDAISEIVIVTRPDLLEEISRRCSASDFFGAARLLEEGTAASLPRITKCPPEEADVKSDVAEIHNRLKKSLLAFSADFLIKDKKRSRYFFFF